MLQGKNYSENKTPKVIHITDSSIDIDAREQGSFKEYSVEVKSSAATARAAITNFSKALEKIFNNDRKIFDLISLEDFLHKKFSTKTQRKTDIEQTFTKDEINRLYKEYLCEEKLKELSKLKDIFDMDPFTTELSTGIASLVIDNNGEIDSEMIEIVKEKMLLFTSPSHNAMIVRTLDRLKKENSDLKEILHTINGIPNDNPDLNTIRSIVCMHLRINKDGSISAVQARRCALSVLFAHFRQEYFQSCYATAIAIGVQNQRPELLLGDLANAMKYGYYTRIINDHGEEMRERPIERIYIGKDIIPYGLFSDKKVSIGTSQNLTSLKEQIKFLKDNFPHLANLVLGENFDLDTFIAKFPKEGKKTISQMQFYEILLKERLGLTEDDFNTYEHFMGLEAKINQISNNLSLKKYTTEERNSLTQQQNEFIDEYSRIRAELSQRLSKIKEYYEIRDEVLLTIYSSQRNLLLSAWEMSIMQLEYYFTVPHYALPYQELIQKAFNPYNDKEKNAAIALVDMVKKLDEGIIEKLRSKNIDIDSFMKKLLNEFRKLINQRLTLHTTTQKNSSRPITYIYENTGEGNTQNFRSITNLKEYTEVISGTIMEAGVNILEKENMLLETRTLIAHIGDILKSKDFTIYLEELFKSNKYSSGSVYLRLAACYYGQKPIQEQFIPHDTRSLISSQMANLKDFINDSKRKALTYLGKEVTTSTTIKKMRTEDAINSIIQLKQSHTQLVKIKEHINNMIIAFAIIMAITLAIILTISDAEPEALITNYLLWIIPTVILRKALLAGVYINEKELIKHDALGERKRVSRSTLIKTLNIIREIETKQIKRPQPFPILIPITYFSHETSSGHVYNLIVGHPTQIEALKSRSIEEWIDKTANKEDITYLVAIDTNYEEAIIPGKAFIGWKLGRGEVEMVRICEKPLTEMPEEGKTTTLDRFLNSDLWTIPTDISFLGINPEERS